MTTAYSYIRYSTPEQSRGDSIRRQLEASEQYAKQHGLDLDTTLQDHGISAFKGANSATGQLGSFIQHIDQGIVQPGSYLLVESIDRLSRDQIMQSLNLFTSILSKGITIVTLADNKIYTKESINDLGNLIYSLVIMSRAHEESKIKSHRATASWSNKRNKAQHGGVYTTICPAWLRPHNGHFEIIPERAELIRRIFDLSITGYGARSIARLFNEEGIDTWDDGIHPGRKADGWYFSYIRIILNAHSTYGTLIPCTGGQLLNPIPNYYPAVIPHHIFLHAQAAIQSRNGKGGNPGNHINIFQGIIRCTVCKGPIVRLNRGNQRQPVFVCDKGRRGVSDCKYNPWPIEEVEQAVLIHLTELDLESILACVDTKLKTIRGSVSSVSGELTSKQTQADRLVKLLAQGADNSPTLLSHLISLESEIAELKGRLETLNAAEKEELESISSVQLAQTDVMNLMDSDNIEMRIRLRSSIRHLITRIILHLPIRKISVQYKPRDVTGDYYSKVIFKSGKLILMNHDELWS